MSTLFSGLGIGRGLEPRVPTRFDAARVTTRRRRRPSVTTTSTNRGDISARRRRRLRAGSGRLPLRPTNGIPARAAVLRAIGLRVRPTVKTDTSEGRCRRRVATVADLRRRVSVVSAKGDSRRRRSAIGCRRRVTEGDRGEKDEDFFYRYKLPRTWVAVVASHERVFSGAQQSILNFFEFE